MDSTIADNKCNSEEGKKRGPRRRFDADPSLPFREYVKIYNREYLKLNRHKYIVPPEERKKTGRPQKHFIENLPITLNEEGLFRCLCCNAVFKHKPERHIQSVKCQLARTKEELAKLKSSC